MEGAVPLPRVCGRPPPTGLVRRICTKRWSGCILRILTRGYAAILLGIGSPSIAVPGGFYRSASLGLHGGAGHLTSNCTCVSFAFQSGRLFAREEPEAMTWTRSKSSSN